MNRGELPYECVNLAFRFSAKAPMPSFWSFCKVYCQQYSLSDFKPALRSRRACGRVAARKSSLPSRGARRLDWVNRAGQLGYRHREQKDMPAPTASLAACTLILPLDEIFSATLIASATVSSCLSLTMRETSPQSLASCAEKLRPVRTISIARDLPMA